LAETDFLATFARRPARAVRGFLPGPRAWVTVTGALVVTCLSLVLIRQVRAGGAQPPPDRRALPAAVRMDTGVPAPGTVAGSVPGSTTPQEPPMTPSTPVTEALPTTTAPPIPSTTPRSLPPAAAPTTRPPVPPPPPPPPAIPGRLLVSAESGLCLSGTAGRDGTHLVIEPCNASAVAQRWEVLSDGTIRSAALCMDAAWASTENLTPVQLAWCSGNPAQQWRLTGAGELRGVQSGKCADIYDRGTAPGTPIKLWPCNGQANQRWR
jgi:hypothetical protein